MSQQSTSEEFEVLFKSVCSTWVLKLLSVVVEHKNRYFAFIYCMLSAHFLSYSWAWSYSITLHIDLKEEYEKRQPNMEGERKAAADEGRHWGIIPDGRIGEA